MDFLKNYPQLKTLETFPEIRLKLALPMLKPNHQWTIQIAAADEIIAQRVYLLTRRGRIYSYNQSSCPPPHLFFQLVEKLNIKHLVRVNDKIKVTLCLLCSFVPLWCVLDCVRNIIIFKRSATDIFANTSAIL